MFTYSSTYTHIHVRTCTKSTLNKYIIYKIEQKTWLQDNSYDI